MQKIQFESVFYVRKTAAAILYIFYPRSSIIFVTFLHFHRITVCDDTKFFLHSTLKAIGLSFVLLATSNFGTIEV